MFHKITTNLMVGDEQIKDRVTIVKDLHTTFYGAEEFYVRDGNGHVLTFASR